MFCNVHLSCTTLCQFNLRVYLLCSVYCTSCFNLNFEFYNVMFILICCCSNDCMRNQTMFRSLKPLVTSLCLYTSEVREIAAITHTFGQRVWLTFTRGKIFHLCNLTKCYLPVLKFPQFLYYVDSMAILAHMIDLVVFQ